eukprot:jgi/Ulvmu1/11782/UM008_0196.1
MNTLLQMLPLLALIAFQSIEVTAQVMDVGSDKFPPLAAAGHTQQIAVSWTTRAPGFEYTISTATGGGCTADQITAGTCTLPSIQWKDGEVPEITISADVPAPGELSVIGGTPSKLAAYFCFSPPSAKNKKWRKINDLFKKDNSCKLSTILKKTDNVDYPAQGGTVQLGTLKLDPKAPTAFFSIRVYVSCVRDDGTPAGKNEFCHVSNRWPLGEGVTADAADVFFPTTVMDSRPTKLYVAVFICACIGPVLFLAFMIYERGFLAKQA